MFYLTKKNGRFDEVSQKVLSDLPDADYTLDKRKKKRTNPQNRYWRGVVDKTIADYYRSQGNDCTNADIHEILTKHYLPMIEVEINGKKYKRQKRISDCSREEFSELKERVQRAFAHIGLIIPDPNQTEFLDVENNV